MGQEFEAHKYYHGTTIDKLNSIKRKGILPIYKAKTGLTGAWATKILKGSIKHARERGLERGGIEPLVLGFCLPFWWVKENNDRKAVDSCGYDENVFCFKIKIPKAYLTKVFYPNK